MGIRLDWEVESEGGNEAVAEDAAALAAQHRRRIMVRRLLLTLAPVILIISTLLGWRLHVTNKARQEALIAVVQAETLALRIGDPDKYLKLQAATDDWRSQQMANFREFQSHVPAITVTNEIMDLEIQGPEARVSVRVLIGNLPDSAVWLYRYSLDKGWQHVSTEFEPWRRESLDGVGYRIEYFMGDEALARQLDLLIKEWWETATLGTGVEHPLPLILTIDPYNETITWANENQTRLNIPAATAVDGLLDPKTVSEMRYELAEQWTLYVLGDPSLTKDEGWVLTETTRWIHDGFEPGESDVPHGEVFLALSGAFGQRFLPGFFAEMQDDPPSVQEALHKTMTGHGPYAERADGLEQYLGDMIRAEIAFHQAYEVSDQNMNEGPAPLTRALFMNEQRSIWSRAVGGQLPYENVIVDSVQILGTEQMEYSDLLWVTTSMVVGHESIMVRIPFIFKDGFWVHTWATERDWGSTYSIRSENITLGYHALDETNISNDMMARLGDIAAQASTDFGVIRQTLNLYIGPSPTQMIGGLIVDGEFFPILPARIDSIYQGGWIPEGTAIPDHYERAMATETIVAIYRAARDPERPPFMQTEIPMTPLDYGILHWELRNLGVDGVYGGRIEPDADSFPIARIHELFVQPTALHFEEWSVTVGAEVLIEILIERYGIHMLPEMISNLQTARTVDDWMLETFGVHAFQFQDEWYERYRQRLEDLAPTP